MHFRERLLERFGIDLKPSDIGDFQRAAAQGLLLGAQERGRIARSVEWQGQTIVAIMTADNQFVITVLTPDQHRKSWKVNYKHHPRRGKTRPEPRRGLDGPDVPDDETMWQG